MTKRQSENIISLFKTDRLIYFDDDLIRALQTVPASVLTHVRMSAGHFHDSNMTLTVSKLIQEICICLTKVFQFIITFRTIFCTAMRSNTIGTWKTL